MSRPSRARCSCSRDPPGGRRAALPRVRRPPGAAARRPHMSESERDTHPARRPRHANAPRGRRRARHARATAPDAAADGARAAAPDAHATRLDARAAAPRRRSAARRRAAGAAAATPSRSPRPATAPTRAIRCATSRAAARVRIRKLRVLGVLLGLGMLAVVSTRLRDDDGRHSDLPALEEPAGAQLRADRPQRQPLGLLTGNQKRIFLQSSEIAPVMKQAIIAIEDRRFYTNAGIDLRGIGRALYAGRARAGGGPGRLDDHDAVRQERARRAGRAHALQQAPRGRARLPDHAQVVQGADPAQLPQHDLLRQRRLRDRVGRAHLLRQRPPRLRRARPAALRAGARRRRRPR